MTVHIAEDGCVVLGLETAPGQDDCVRLVREVLAEAGRDVWEGMELSLFCAGGKSLLIARPGNSLRISVAPWLAPWLS